MHRVTLQTTKLIITKYSYLSSNAGTYTLSSLVDRKLEYLVKVLKKPSTKARSIVSQYGFRVCSKYSRGRITEDDLIVDALFDNITKCPLS